MHTSYIVKFVILPHCMFLYCWEQTPSSYNPCQCNKLLLQPL